MNTLGAPVSKKLWIVGLNWLSIMMDYKLYKDLPRKIHMLFKIKIILKTEIVKKTYNYERRPQVDENLHWQRKKNFRKS